MAETDLSKVIELIMSHPEIIAEINGLIKSERKEEGKNTDGASDESAQAISDALIEKSEQARATEAASAYISDSQNKDGSARRGELLRALKPYVSEERGKAIESMLTIADILDVMRKK